MILLRQFRQMETKRKHKRMHYEVEEFKTKHRIGKVNTKEQTEKMAAY